MRFAFTLALLVAALFVGGPTLARAAQNGPGVTVVEVEGPLDQRLIDFVTGVVDDAAAPLTVLRVDSPGVASGDITRLVAAIANAPDPVVAWIGPQGARAFGGALQIAAAADYVGAAQGSVVGYALPTVAGSGPSQLVVEAPGIDALADSRLELADGTGLPGFVTALTPSIGQFIASLDGLELRGAVVETAETRTLADGSQVIVPSVQVQFLKPGLMTRFLRLSIKPDAAFFFLAAGLVLVFFEFYAAGVGLVAGIAALSLFIAAYGIGVLPVRWWAVALTVAGIVFYTWDFQRVQLGWRSILGTTALVVGGLFFTHAAPQFGASWWVVVIVAAVTGLFYLFAMTTVVRSRFSTPTIGREYLIGRLGIAESTFSPEGVVSVSGARWRGRAARAAVISPGDRLVVRGVKGIILDVDPVEDEEDGV